MRSSRFVRGVQGSLGLPIRVLIHSGTGRPSSASRLGEGEADPGSAVLSC